MPEPESIREAFERTDPPLRDVARYVRETLDSYCRQRNYLFNDRVKTPESLAEKLEGGRYQRWSRLDDLYACTVVVPVHEHEERVIRHLNAVFRCKRVRGREQVNKAPDVFRFDGTRWYGTISTTAAEQRQPGAGDLVFEVQVVTAFEYAWMAVTHDLVYKADTVDWRKLRLAAQLKAAVEQVEVLISAFDTASVAVQQSPWPETTAKLEIVDSFKTLATDGHIPETLIPSSWRRFSDNVYALVDSYTEDKRAVASSVTRLLGAIASDLRAPEAGSLPTSGTLFQYVISIVARQDAGDKLRDFTVVPSRELRDLYGVTTVPRRFVFDGIAAQPEASTDVRSAPAPPLSAGDPETD